MLTATWKSQWLGSVQEIGTASEGKTVILLDRISRLWSHPVMGKK